MSTLVSRRESFRSGLAAVGAALGVARLAPPGRAAEIPIQGVGDPALAPFDRMMRDVLAEAGVQGGTLAVASAGKLVLARGYGWADRERGLPVLPATRFCLGSVTKAVTGVAVLRLIQAGRFGL